MTASTSPLTGVDRLADRTGLSSDAVAILVIVAGILVIAFPQLLRFTVGILLIGLGVYWLVERQRGRQALPPAP